MTDKRLDFDQTDCTLNPGELIQHSGIYEICHVDDSRATVLLMRHTYFPFCRQCGENVRYRLVRPVPHISEDEDFHEAGGDNPGYSMKTHISTPTVQLGRAHGFRFHHQDNLQTWGTRSESGNL
ncbi:MAG TPA: hypothetical protein VIB39_22465 [Candidatus Angelobacter sp.]